jgi:chromosomal replication initiation ATPase DnaA
VKRGFCQIGASEITEESRREAGVVWGRVLGALRGQMIQANFRTWLNDSRGLICRENVFVIGVPNNFVADYLDHNLRSLVEKTIIDVTRSRYAVSFLVERN